MKKIIAVLLSVVFALSCFSVCAFAFDEKQNYLLLGDSITQGFGVENPEEASYGKIVADTNGYNYTNDAQFARNSTRLLQLIQEDDIYRYDIAQADIISLSIGANDYLASSDVVSLVAGAIFGINDSKLDEIAENYYTNLCEIISIIKSINPSAVILLQTVYVAWTGFAGKAFNAGASRVNAMIERYVDKHPLEVTLCDISPAMTGHPENLADDCVHPNDKGNVAIAEIVLAKLYEMGIGTQTVPVVNVQGINYNYFKKYISKEFGGIITVLVKVLTGNSCNVRFSDIF